MTKWHITDSFEAKPCEVDTGKCPYTGSEHFDNARAAELGAELQALRAAATRNALPAQLADMQDLEARKIVIADFIEEMYVQERLKWLRWAALTKQTPSIGGGYFGQHLASLILGQTGSGSGARGNDILDGTEVKTCNLADQLGTCKKCGERVAGFQETCPNCGATAAAINRKNDSNWAFAITKETELETLTGRIPRVLMIVTDHPGFDAGNRQDIRIRAFELDPTAERHSQFALAMQGYYKAMTQLQDNALEGKTAERPKAAPKTFYPDQFPFYMANPVEVFSCTIEDANRHPTLKIDNLVDPATPRAKLKSPDMPSSKLQRAELTQLVASMSATEFKRYTKGYTGTQADFGKLKKSEQVTVLPWIDERLRSRLQLRETKLGTRAAESYLRDVQARG